MWATVSINFFILVVVMNTVFVSGNLGELGMISLFRACSSISSKATSLLLTKSPSSKHFFQSSAVRTVNLELLSAKLQFQCYSSKSSRKGKTVLEPIMKEDKESFFVVRKGDLVGVYKSLSDCQAQVGTSICDPPVSVYKGNSMPKDTEKYLISCGLKNALYSIRASDLTEELFGTLVSCPLQPSSSRGETSSSEPVSRKRPQELWSEYGEPVGPILPPSDALAKHFKFEPQSLSRCCTLEFDGASKGNPGQAGAGAIVKSDDGSLICRVREGLGIATNNVAEYRAFILGLKCALAKGFTTVQARGDSKLVCMQVQGQWKVKNQNISCLYDEAKKLMGRFSKFQIMHVLRDLNSEADAQANLAVDLAAGQIQEDIDK
ncbi:hypothetical protein ABFX02_12G116500 [Erythranthe guttata]